MPAHQRASELSTPAAPVVASAPLPGSAEVQTMPVDAPPGSGTGQGTFLGQSTIAGQSAVPAGMTIRVGLMLPLSSASFGPASNALRAGFMAAYEREPSGFVINLIDSGETAQAALTAYAGALPTNDILVGPLARSAVTAVASSGMVDKPTIALNHPDVGIGAEILIPDNMLVMGLSIEEQARQVALWAADENPGAKVLIVSGTSAWQRRIANAFAAQWARLGLRFELAEMIDSNGYLSEAGINQLKLQVDADPPALLFAALDADQLRQVRGILGTELPVYGASSVNPGSEPGSALPELNGVRLLDLPWEVQLDHPAVMVYPRWSVTRAELDMDRLYALGIDAFRVAREIALHRESNFTMDGVTGRLSVRFGTGPSSFERISPTAVYQDGMFVPATGTNMPMPMPTTTTP
jgi:hypothetical protein